MEQFSLDITSEANRFKEHLEIPNNVRIIFSGIFGIGKTYFLKEFIKIHSNKYDIVFLSPVNYSVSTNEDIFEYIKYDIAFELLGKDISFEKLNYSKILTAQFYIQDNFIELISLLAEYAGKIGKGLKEISQSLVELKKGFDKYHSEVNVSEDDLLIDFLKKSTEKNGTIFEENKITRIISEIVETLEKETILIIDDLDRIDPEHIFRILNVFACHFDFQCSEKNKFSFDKVILVCDIENIRRIFYNKYGQDVDFSGYIDKFFSKEIFHFNNNEVVKNSIEQIVKSIDAPIVSDFKLNHPQQAEFKFITNILAYMVTSNAINLRSLLKLINTQYKPIEYSINVRGNIIKNWQFLLFQILDFLVYVLGSTDSLRKALVECDEKNSKVALSVADAYLLNYVVALIDVDKNNFKHGNYQYENTNINFKFDYEIKVMYQGDYSVKVYKKNFEYLDTKEPISTDFPYYKFLNLAFEKFQAFRIN